LLGWRVNEWWWLFFVASGITVSVLLAIFFNPVLIVLTSFIGALLIIQAVPFTPEMKILMFVILVASGILVQGNHYFYAKH
ncbi:MAG TPA: hypothetical protein PKV48_07140, partial [Thermodesulfobacteriota bacterium]|nr:hypothetical protein [Thermodesulfobacteriota bacterium]